MKHREWNMEVRRVIQERTGERFVPSLTLPGASPEVQRAFCAWLLLPTDLHRWPPPAKFDHRRLPFTWAHLRDCSQEERVRLLSEELQALRQTLDFPPEALRGLTRNGLLAVHGIRLRQSGASSGRAALPGRSDGWLPSAST